MNRIEVPMGKVPSGLFPVANCNLKTRVTVSYGDRRFDTGILPIETPLQDIWVVTLNPCHQVVAPVAMGLC